MHAGCGERRGLYNCNVVGFFRVPRWFIRLRVTLARVAAASRRQLPPSAAPVNGCPCPCLFFFPLELLEPVLTFNAASCSFLQQSRAMKSQLPKTLRSPSNVFGDDLGASLPSLPSPSPLLFFAPFSLFLSCSSGQGAIYAADSAFFFELLW